MSIRLNERTRNPRTGRLEKTGRQLRPTYNRRGGGGYSRSSNPTDEPLDNNKLSADRNLAQAKADAANKARLEAQTNAEKEKQKLLAAQRVTRQLNESAARSQSPNRYALKADQQANVYIETNRPPPNEPRSNRQLDTSDPRSVLPREVPKEQTQESGFERRIRRTQEYEQAINERAAKREADFKTIPLLRGDNFFQRGARYAAQIPGFVFTELPERIVLSSRKGFALVEGLTRKDTRSSTLKEAGRAAKETPAVVAKSFDPTTPEGLVNLGFVAIGTRGSKAPKAEIDVGASRTRAVETDLPGGKAIDITEGQFKATAGKKQYEGETRTASTTRPDAANTFIQAEKTEVVLREVKSSGKTGKEFTAVSRTDLQIKATGSGTKAKGTTTQVTNLGKKGLLRKEKAVQQSGVTTAVTKQKTPDVAITRSYTETGKVTKAKPTTNPEALTYDPKGLGKPIEATVSKSKTTTLLETEGSLYPQIAEAAGVEVRAPTTPGRQRVTDTKLGSVTGTKVLDAARGPQRSAPGVKVRPTEGGGALVEIGSPRQFKKPQTLSPVPSEGTPVLVTDVLSSRSPSPRAAVAFKLAVENVAAAEARTTAIKATGARAAAVTAPKTTTRTKTRQEGTQSRRQASGIESVTATAPRSKTDTTILLKPSEKQDTRTRAKPRQLPRQQPRQTPIQVPKFLPAQRQEQEQVLELETLQQTRSRTQSRTTPRQRPIETPKLLAGRGRSPQKADQGFAVFVRRKGIFGKVNASPLTKGEALRLGANIARSSAAASFKLEKVQGRPRGKRKNAPDLIDFDLSKKERGVFIQKREKRISSAGELREITFAGIRASRGRR